MVDCRIVLPGAFLLHGIPIVETNNPLVVHALKVVAESGKRHREIPALGILFVLLRLKGIGNAEVHRRPPAVDNRGMPKHTALRTVELADLTDILAKRLLDTPQKHVQPAYVPALPRLLKLVQQNKIPVQMNIVDRPVPADHVVCTGRFMDILLSPLEERLSVCK